MNYIACYFLSAELCLLVRENSTALVLTSRTWDMRLNGIPEDGLWRVVCCCHRCLNPFTPDKVARFAQKKGVNRLYHSGTELYEFSDEFEGFEESLFDVPEEEMKKEERHALSGATFSLSFLEALVPKRTKRTPRAG